MSHAELSSFPAIAGGVAEVNRSYATDPLRKPAHAYLSALAIEMAVEDSATQTPVAQDLWNGWMDTVIDPLMTEAPRRFRYHHHPAELVAKFSNYQ